MSSSGSDTQGAGYRAAGNYNQVLTDKQLTECDRERLELIGTIQSNSGFFFQMHYPSGKILAHSDNIGDFGWLQNNTDNQTPKKLLGGLAQDCFSESNCNAIFNLAMGVAESKTQRNFQFLEHDDEDGSVSAISVSATGGDYHTVGVEVEPVDNEDTANQFSLTLVHLGRIVQFSNNSEIARSACESVFHLVEKYDRGMVYKFHDDLSGEVVFEIKKDFVKTSYEGLRFPASDIPLSSRQLYIKNGVRYIHDVKSDSVPILSEGSEPVDLTQIRMRGVTPPHITYLNNMGVKSSMALAIVVDGELWGMLAFHAYKETHKPSLHQRIACETISSMLSVQIESQKQKSQAKRIIDLGELLQNLKQDVSVIHNIYDWGDAILKIVDADVMVCHVCDPRDGEGDEYTIGNTKLTPSPDFWTTMVTRHARELTVASTRAEIQDLGLDENCCPATGIIFFQEGRTQVMLGRDIRADDIAWGGTPDEPKTRINGMLQPRASFAKVIEKARKEARAWSNNDVAVISVMRDRICEHSHKYNMGLLKHDIQDTNDKYMLAMERARDNYDFFAHMSHEIRTPFHGVMGCLNILNEGVEEMSPVEVRDVVDTAIVSGNHMINLLNEILDISKSKHLSHVVSEDRIIYQTLAFETIDSMKALATSRNTKLVSSIEPAGNTKQMIITDKTKTIQIVSNLVNNAIKFTSDAGSIDIRYRLVKELKAAVGFFVEGAKKHNGSAFAMTEGEMHTDIDEVTKVIDSCKEEPGQRWMAVAIADTGCGMNPTELVNMFRPYTQANRGSNRAVQGTGLGLFICVSLCFRLGGFISCSSTLGVGTEFHVGIPVALSTGNEEPEAEADESVGQKLEPIHMSGPILVADDNVVNVKILKRSLLLEIKRAGKDINLLTAGGGPEAVELYKENRPSLCIIDYHMPDTDGIEATKLIREYEAAHNIDPPSYITIYTADVTERATELILKSGVNDIMMKPPPHGFITNLVHRLHTP